MLGYECDETQTRSFYMHVVVEGTEEEKLQDTVWSDSRANSGPKPKQLYVYYSLYNDILSVYLQREINKLAK